MRKNTTRFIKSFSKGQITIPKAVRDALGIKDEFWLKMYTEGGKIIAEPIEKEKNTPAYYTHLLTLKGDWFDTEEWKEIREEMDKKVKKIWKEK